MDRIVKAVGARGDGARAGRWRGARAVRAGPARTSTACRRRAGVSSSCCCRAAPRTCARSSIAATPSTWKHYLTGWNEARCARRARGASVDPGHAGRAGGHAAQIIPRLCSIASAEAHPDQVDLLVVSVKCAIQGRVREAFARPGWPNAGRSAQPRRCSRRTSRSTSRCRRAATSSDDHDRSRHWARAVPILFWKSGVPSAPAATGCSSASSAGPLDFFYEDQFAAYVNDGFCASIRPFHAISRIKSTCSTGCVNRRGMCGSGSRRRRVLRLRRQGTWRATSTPRSIKS